MDANKLRGLSIGDFITRAQTLGEKLEPDNPDFVDSFVKAIVGAAVNGDQDVLNTIAGYFGNDDDISSALFPETSEPITVTKTTTSVGGLPGDMTPEEDEMLADAAKGINPDKDADLDADPGITSLMDEIINSDEDTDSILAKHGFDVASSDNGSASNESLDKPDKKDEEPAVPNPDEPPAVEDKTAAEEAADKPKESSDKSSEEKKNDKPKEDKKEDKNDAEQDDTTKNILAGIEGRI